MCAPMDDATQGPHLEGSRAARSRGASRQGNRGHHHLDYTALVGALSSTFYPASCWPPGRPVRVGEGGEGHAGAGPVHPAAVRRRPRAWGAAPSRRVSLHWPSPPARSKVTLTSSWPPPIASPFRVDVDAYESDLRKIDTENIDDVMSMMNDCLAEKVRLISPPSCPLCTGLMLTLWIVLGCSTEAVTAGASASEAAAAGGGTSSLAGG